MLEPTVAQPDEVLRQQMVEAAAEVIRELFGMPCQHTRMAVTLDAIPCGRCKDCTRDWTPEGRAVLAAALALLPSDETIRADERAKILAELNSLCVSGPWGRLSDDEKSHNVALQMAAARIAAGSSSPAGSQT